MILSAMTMKRIGLIVSALLFSFIVSGQTVYDIILHSKALNQSGNSDEAEELLSETIAKTQDYRLLLERGETKILDGNYNGAISDFNSAGKVNPLSGEFGLARIYALKNDAATSLYHLEQSMRSSFKKSEKEIMLDPAFSLIENKPEWRRFWQKEWYTESEKKIPEIEFYISAGKTEEAALIQAEFERNYSGNDEALYAAALIKVSGGKYPEAINALSKLVSSEPENEKYLRLLAKAQSSSSNYAGASVTLSRLIELEIPDAGLFIQRAESFLKTGEYGNAMTDVERYLGIYPEDKNALTLAGKINTTSGNNLKALEYLSRNLELHPNDAECYNDRANAWLSAKSWDWAIKDYSMALDLEPANSNAWLNKGIALLNSGKIQDACFDFRRSLALGNKRATEYISKNCIK
jgi:tetratricopeptide (TPR) repeat protein